ncbi:MAG: amidohydrolase family protein [Polyangiaceae bacterium]|nr:amidohydrolase family protein [Polyangiaceae bacterium]
MAAVQRTRLQTPSACGPHGEATGNRGLGERRPWHHPDYDPLWAGLAKLGVTVCFHDAGRTHLTPDYSLVILDKIMLWHTFNQPIGIMSVLATMIAGGVIDRFPKLRFGLLEGNCSWAPWLTHRLDEHWEWIGRLEAPDLTQAPSEYFKSNCFLSLESN